MYTDLFHRRAGDCNGSCTCESLGVVLELVWDSEKLMSLLKKSRSSVPSKSLKLEWSQNSGVLLVIYYLNKNERYQ